MKCFENVFRDKNVLITGHTGFKGSWLSIWLKELGANVIGYSLNPNTKDDNFVKSNISNKIIDIRGDIRDIEELRNIFKKYKIDIVFHLAAQPLVRFSYENPKYTYDVNVLGTVNILECIRENNSAKCCIVITTDKCYENKEWIWGYRENDRLGGYDPYSCSKACVELIVNSYKNSFLKGKTEISTVRAGNVIGGGDWSKDRLIPDCIKSLEKEEIIKIRNPNSVRPWQHVIEPLYGYLLLASKMISKNNYSDAYNFGPDYKDFATTEDVVRKVINHWGDGLFTYEENSTFMKESNLLMLDCSKSRNILNWKSVLSLDEAVKLTVDWYKNYENTDVYKLCIDQINYYLSKEGFLL